MGGMSVQMAWDLGLLIGLLLGIPLGILVYLVIPGVTDRVHALLRSVDDRGS